MTVDLIKLRWPQSISLHLGLKSKRKQLFRDVKERCCRVVISKPVSLDIEIYFFHDIS